MICSHTRAPPETKFPGYRQVTPPQYKSFVPSERNPQIFLDEPTMALTNSFVVVGSDIDHAQRVIHAAESAQLRGWSKNVFTATSMDGVFAASSS